MSELPPRTARMKGDLLRLLEALERNPEIETVVRVVQLEDDLSHAWAEARRWRDLYKTMRGVIVAASGPHPDLDALDRVMREWAVRGDE